MQMWLHTINGKNYALFTHDMTEDAEKKLEKWASSTHPFDKCFNTQLEYCYDIENMGSTPAQPIFFAYLDARAK